MKTLQQEENSTLQIYSQGLPGTIPENWSQ